MENHTRKHYETGLNEKGEKLKDDEISPAMKEIIADRKVAAEKQKAEIKYNYYG